MSKPTEKKPTTSVLSSTATNRRKSQGKKGKPNSSNLAVIVVLLAAVSLAACNVTTERSETTSTVANSGDEVTIRFLDVGQGDAILVQSPEGKTMLLDGGRSIDRMKAHLETYDITKVDLMVASHADADHIAGLVAAANQTKPTLFINNGLSSTTQTWDHLVTALEAAGTKFQKANNQSINLGSVKVKIISPPEGMSSNQNDNSIGVVVQYGKFRALMTGDSETPETKAWLSENNPNLAGPFQAYKSIHHGAANGDNQPWLSAMQPENVVISVGDNSYGHPTANALNLYKQNNIRIYRTDQQGTITFKGQTSGEYRVSTER